VDPEPKLLVLGLELEAGAKLPVSGNPSAGDVQVDIQWAVGELPSV
jgi:hypothetical protein